MPKVKMTFTLEKEQLEYIKSRAKKWYEGNEAMALRGIIVDHKNLVNNGATN